MELYSGKWSNIPHYPSLSIFMEDVMVRVNIVLKYHINKRIYTLVTLYAVKAVLL
jgi:hypothetical protein